MYVRGLYRKFMLFFLVLHSAAMLRHLSTLASFNGLSRIQAVKFVDAGYSYRSDSLKCDECSAELSPHHLSEISDPLAYHNASSDESVCPFLAGIPYLQKALPGKGNSFSFVKFPKLYVQCTVCIKY